MIWIIARRWSLRRRFVLARSLIMWIIARAALLAGADVRFELPDPLLEGYHRACGVRSLLSAAPDDLCPCRCGRASRRHPSSPPRVRLRFPFRERSS